MFGVSFLYCSQFLIENDEKSLLGGLISEGGDHHLSPPPILIHYQQRLRKPLPPLKAPLLSLQPKFHGDHLTFQRPSSPELSNRRSFL